jgi:hypothetical protein
MSKPATAPAKRKRGQPKKFTPCPWCGKLHGVADLRMHMPKCPKRK